MGQGQFWRIGAAIARICPVTYSKKKNASLIDEFESMFEASASPEFEILPTPLERVLVVYDRSQRNNRTARTAELLADRFGCALTEMILPGAPAPTGRQPESMGDGDVSQAIKRRIEELDPQLVLLPCPFFVAEEQPESHSLGGIVDELIGEMPQPFLLVRTRERNNPFEKVMVYVPGTIGVEKEFSLAFKLVGEQAHLELYHVVDEDVVRTAAEALEVVSTVETEVGRQALIEGLQKKVQQLLRSATEAAHDLPFDLTSRIDMGHPVEMAVERVRDQHFGLVVLRIRPGDREERDHISEEMAREMHDLHVLVV